MILPLTSLGGLIFFGGRSRVGVPMMEDPRIIQATDPFLLGNQWF